MRRLSISPDTGLSRNQLRPGKRSESPPGGWRGWENMDNLITYQGCAILYIE